MTGVTQDKRRSSLARARSRRGLVARRARRRRAGRRAAATPGPALAWANVDELAATWPGVTRTDVTGRARPRPPGPDQAPEPTPSPRPRPRRRPTHRRPPRRQRRRATRPEKQRPREAAEAHEAAEAQPTPEDRQQAADAGRPPGRARRAARTRPRPATGTSRLPARPLPPPAVLAPATTPVPVPAAALRQPSNVTAPTRPGPRRRANRCRHRPRPRPTRRRTTVPCRAHRRRRPVRSLADAPPGRAAAPALVGIPAAARPDAAGGVLRLGQRGAVLARGGPRARRARRPCCEATRRLPGRASGSTGPTSVSDVDLAGVGADQCRGRRHVPGADGRPGAERAYATDTDRAAPALGRRPVPAVLRLRGLAHRRGPAHRGWRRGAALGGSASAAIALRPRAAFLAAIT